MIIVAGTEEASGRAGQAPGLITPRNAFARAERVFHLRHIMLKRTRSSECRGEIKRAALVGENKRLLGRHRELFGRRFKSNTIRGSLDAEPLSEILSLPTSQTPSD